MAADPDSGQTDDQDPADPDSASANDGGTPAPAAAAGANADPAPTQFGSAGGKAGQLPDPDTYAPLIGTTTGSEFNTIRAAIIPFACWRADDMRFAFDASVPDPGLAVEMENLADLMAAHPGCVLGVFGHADPVGSDDLNKHLSGRRAAAIYGLLTGRTEIWNDLYTDGGVFAKPVPGDVWGEQSLQMMLSALGRSDDVSNFTRNTANRLGLFSDYMAQIAGPVGVLPKERFLGHGEDPAGKADFQGCGEFNPMLIFSQAEEDAFSQAKDKSDRNTENAKNRRVMVLLFRKGTRVTPSKWPCPRAKEEAAGCRKRFWSDGEDRRSATWRTNAANSKRRKIPSPAAFTIGWQTYLRANATGPGTACSSCSAFRPTGEWCWRAGSIKSAATAILRFSLAACSMATVYCGTSWSRRATTR